MSIRHVRQGAKKQPSAGNGRGAAPAKKDNQHIRHDHGDKHFHDKYHAHKPIPMVESKYDHIGDELLHELEAEKKKKHEHYHHRGPPQSAGH